ncbi:MAG: sugar kinase [Chitinophaga sp.]|uniref:sugar kinase n=1 Tax=Chitinophaga sp. TaxID=1869181 RepID=UPI0025C1C0AB|nr:sugar kinase [Chitinophaga sp.]MBV8251949.1 sugar kinase [Chitinophaga sp.]
MQLPYGDKAPRVTGFGEFLLRLHSSSGTRFQQATNYIPYYAGAEANVCVLLAKLGMQADYVSRIPENELAKTGVQQLRAHGVNTEHLTWGGERLGLYFTEAGNQIRPTTVIYDRHASSFATTAPGDFNWQHILQQSTCFHWSGVAAAVSESAAAVCREALETAASKGLRVSSDFNYRSRLWQYGKHPAEVMPDLLRFSHIAVADLDAANTYYGITTDSNASFETQFQQCFEALKEHMPRLEALGMTFRHQHQNQLYYTGALAYNNAFYFSRSYHLHNITDQIGTGDAFTAGLLYGLLQKLPPQQVVDFATACGVIKQSIPGDWALVNREEVALLMQQGPSGRISR